MMANVKEEEHLQAMAQWATTIYTWISQLYQQPWVPQDLRKKMWRFMQTYPGKEGLPARP